MICNLFFSLVVNGAYKLINNVLEIVNIIIVIFIECKDMYRIVCMGENEVWISGKNNIIIRVDIYGCVKEKIEINGRFMFFNIFVII